MIVFNIGLTSVIHKHELTIGVLCPLSLETPSEKILLIMYLSLTTSFIK